MNTFVLLHIPIFAVLVALIASTDDRLRQRSRLGVSVFLIIHAVLHLWFTKNADYEFTSLTSDMLILGGALFGGFHIAASYKDTRFSQ
jgi:MFS-type transporter involved in bile tolerance (Atg22 family)